MVKGNGIYVGIDLGTNNSCIAVYKYDRAEVVSAPDGSRLTPSFVYIGENKDEIYVGKSAKNYGHKHPERLLYDNKRLLGTKATDTLVTTFKKQWTFETSRDRETGYCNYKIDGKTYTPEVISSKILEKLKSYIDDKIEGVVITVPAYFSSEQKSKILETADMAKLNVMQVVCEPTAAAIAYGMEHSYTNGEILFVFDMGGGTFDVTVIQVINANHFKVLALGGNSKLGGRDFDWVIIDWIKKELIKQVPNFDMSKLPRKRYKIMEMAKEAKESLSQAEDAIIQLSEIHNDANDVVLTRPNFEELSSKLMESVREKIYDILKADAMKGHEINHVLFVGGASKMPMINKLLKEFFNEAKFSKTVNAEEIVALGATRWAAKLGQQSTRNDIKNIELQDAVALKIGIEVEENGKAKFQKVFDSNSPYGEEKSITLTTSEDNQTKAEIALYEGYSDDLDRNTHIGSIELIDLPPKPAGNVKVNVIIKVNKNGIVEVVTKGIPCKINYKSQLLKDQNVKK